VKLGDGRFREGFLKKNNPIDALILGEAAQYTVELRTPIGR
jgi:hypothetical protein